MKKRAIFAGLFLFLVAVVFAQPRFADVKVEILNKGIFGKLPSSGSDSEGYFIRFTNNYGRPVRVTYQVILQDGSKLWGYKKINSLDYGRTRTFETKLKTNESVIENLDWIDTGSPPPVKVVEFIEIKIWN